MSEIFISYSRKDEQFVSRLVSDLEREGWDVFYDRKMIPSQDFATVLSQEIELAKYFLVVLSPNSLAPSSQVYPELKAALRLEREQRTTVVPLLIEASDPQKVNDLIGTKYYANFTVSYQTGFLELSATLAGPKAKRNGRKKSMGLKETGIGAVVITGVFGLVAAYWQYVYKPAHSDQSETIQYAGRVMDLNTQKVVSGAKVSVDTQGVPQVYYSDSDGVFYLKLPGSSDSARIRVEANGYEAFDRNVSLSRTGIEDVRLTPLPVNKDNNLSNQKTGSVHSSKKPAKTNNQEQVNRIDRILKSSSSNKPN